MRAYVVVTETVNDQAMFDAYRKEVRATLVPFGGQFVVRGGNLTILEGVWPHPRLVIIEFPSRRAARDWYKSEAYQKVIGLRLKSTISNMVIATGRISGDEHDNPATPDQRRASVMDRSPISSTAG